MKHKIVGILIGFLIFFVCFSLFSFDSTGFVTLFLQKQGSTINYRFSDLGNFAQCIDDESGNNIYERGTCHTQLKTANNLYGISSVDYCKSKEEVVDYYCSAGMLCTEVVNSCPKGYICWNGKCTDDFKPYGRFELKNLLEKFRSFLPR